MSLIQTVCRSLAAILPAKQADHYRLLIYCWFVEPQSQPAPISAAAD
jgi:hypothetical protein